MLLKDKCLIISGIGPGLGVKLAVEAAREGASALAISARTMVKLEDAEARIREVNPDCQVLKQVTDIRDEAACQRLVAATVSAFGRVDGLINSAFAWSQPAPAASADLAGWREVYETNLLGSMQMIQAVVPVMQRQAKGAIVNVSTQAAVMPSGGGESAYAASKAALGAATRYLALELGADNIRVNVVRMGRMWGVPIQQYLAYMAKQQNVAEQVLYDGFAANIALKRLVTDTECARAALFMVSDYASAITGASLDANGGEWMPT